MYASINKQELARRVAERTGMDHLIVDVLLDAVLEEIFTALKHE